MTESAARFKANPTERDILSKNALTWIRGKRIDDAASPYWRVHDKLYDLQGFIEKHPGGPQWLEVTQGSDITEVFESSHFGSVPKSILKNYYVKDATTPRNSPYTFKEDGFFMTLKGRVEPILNTVGRKPTNQMLWIQDSFLLSFLTLMVLSAVTGSTIVAIIAGMTLAPTVIVAHNFFHVRDNIRMYIFDLMMLSSYEWRITHALSHHPFPNTIYDAEVSMFEPFLEFLPNPNKSWLKRVCSPIYCVIIYVIGFPLDSIKRIYHVYVNHSNFRPENYLVLVELLLMSIVIMDFGKAFRLWVVMHVAANLTFLALGITVAHHHPDIYHEGDAFRTDPDWGLCQLDATRDRPEIIDNILLSVISFGDHTLHHLFPTVDQSKLVHLYPVFIETCREFGHDFQLISWWEMAVGKMRQLSRATPNPIAPGGPRASE